MSDMAKAEGRRRTADDQDGTSGGARSVDAAVRIPPSAICRVVTVRSRDEIVREIDTDCRLHSKARKPAAIFFVTL
jgi:hypothetical protein